MQNNFLLFKAKITNRFRYRLFLLRNLPAAYFAGLKIIALDAQHAIVAVPYKWFTKNPFRSIYFAVLSMAAEMSTGLLCMGNTYLCDPGVSMLVLKVEGDFLKKAAGKIYFTCNDGNNIKEAVQEAILSGNAKTMICHSVGRNEMDETVAAFYITWSFKARIQK